MTQNAEYDGQPQPSQAATSAANEMDLMQDQLQRQRAEMTFLKTQVTDMSGTLNNLTQLIKNLAGPQVPTSAQEGGQAGVTVTNTATPVFAQMATQGQNTTVHDVPSTATPRPHGHVTEPAGQVVNETGEGSAYDLPGAEPCYTFALPAKEPINDEAWEEKIAKIVGEKVKEIQPRGSPTDLNSYFLFPKVDLPPKFKLPTFARFKGDGNPEFHLKHYCSKLGALTREEGVLLMYFQESLEGPALDWFMQLDHPTIKTWGDLANRFVKYYRHNIDMVPTRDEVRAVKMKPNETFREYASRWRQLAMQVRPIMEESEMITYFVRMLPDPYYNHLLGSHAHEFSDLIKVGERIDAETREGRAGSKGSGANTRVAPKKEETKVNFIEGDQAYKTSSRQPRDSRPLPNCGLTNSQLLQNLYSQNIMVPVPVKPFAPPYPKWYRPELQCEYHMGVKGHSIDKCEGFRQHVWKLIDGGVISLEEAGPNVLNNPLPRHNAWNQGG